MITLMTSFPLAIIEHCIRTTSLT